MNSCSYKYSKAARQVAATMECTRLHTCLIDIRLISASTAIIDTSPLLPAITSLFADTNLKQSMKLFIISTYNISDTSYCTGNRANNSN